MGSSFISWDLHSTCVKGVQVISSKVAGSRGDDDACKVLRTVPVHLKDLQVLPGPSFCQQAGLGKSDQQKIRGLKLKYQEYSAVVL